MKKKFLKWLFKEVMSDPAVKKEFVDKLLSDTCLGFNIYSNTLNDCTVYDNVISLKTTRNIILDEVIIPKGFSLQITQD